VSKAEHEPQTRLDLRGGRLWLRSKGYRLEAGTIRLAPDAELELYDPWQEWASAADEERPYKRLLRLVQQLNPPRFNLPLPRRKQALLERWVQKNGLLGILPHETLEATMAPRWVDERQFMPVYEPSTPGVRSFVAAQRQRRWLPQARRWQDSTSRVGQARMSDPDREGELVPDKEVSGDRLPVEVRCRRLQDGSIQPRPLGEYYHGFFPDVPPAEAATYDYPSVETERFWRGYAESARQFVETGRFLSAALEGLARVRAGQLGEDELGPIRAALEPLNAIASVANLSGSLPEVDGFAVGWSSPSLLGMYGLMLLEDLKAGQQVQRCANCDVYFLAKNPRALYCSTTCRNAQQKRQWRKARTERQIADEASGDD
jgi:hypothetical protein